MEPNFKLSSGNYKVWKFPSGELQVSLLRRPSQTEPTTITGSILSSDNIIELLQLVETLNYTGWNNLELTIPYCDYSRQDRRCNPGEAFSLKVFANLINSCNFTSVTTYDNHSDVATALINNCNNRHVKDLLIKGNNLIKRVDRPNQKYETLISDVYGYFVSPDAGANKKVFDCSKRFNIPMIRADKVRDTATGAILETQVYATPEQLKNKTVLIIDDICQGGRTFEELAKALKAIEPTVTVHLYCTHGFFNKGFNAMKEAGISKFITTDSVPQVHTCNELTIVNL